MLSLFATPIASSYSLVGRGLCTHHDAPLHPYIRSFHPFNILDADSSGNKDAQTAGLSMPKDGGALAKALCDATPDCGYVVFYVNENNQYEAQNYFMYSANITLDLTPDPGLAVCDGDPTDCNQPECLKREEEEECTICPDIEVFDECPGLSSESACDASPNCGWCENHNECRVSCTCNDDSPPSPSLFQACNYVDGEPTSVVERWPRVIHLGFPLVQKRWAPECTCAEPTGWVGPKDHIEFPLDKHEWSRFHAWLAEPAAAIFKKLLGWAPRDGWSLGPESLQTVGEDAQLTGGGKSDVSKAHYIGEDQGIHRGVAVGNPGAVHHEHVFSVHHEHPIGADHEDRVPVGEVPCTNTCTNLCEPINPGDMDDDMPMNAYCACLKSCGCGSGCD